MTIESTVDAKGTVQRRVALTLSVHVVLCVLNIGVWYYLALPMFEVCGSRGFYPWSYKAYGAVSGWVYQYRWWIAPGLPVLVWLDGFAVRSICERHGKELAVRFSRAVGFVLIGILGFSAWGISGPLRHFWYMKWLEWLSDQMR